jgi:hypothetical protein
MLPYYTKEDFSFNIDQNYKATSESNYGYYNVKNIYNKVGYWNEEIYRLGVVYILSDNTLSPVFNIRGCNGIPTKDSIDGYYKTEDLYDDDSRKYLQYDEETCLIESGTAPLENIKGVIRINDNTNDDDVYCINVSISDEII